MEGHRFERHLCLHHSARLGNSKVPVITGPVNLPGPLPGNFVGTERVFLEAPVNFPGTYRGR